MTREEELRLIDAWLAVPENRERMLRQKEEFEKAIVHHAVNFNFPFATEAYSLVTGGRKGARGFAWAR